MQYLAQLVSFITAPFKFLYFLVGMSLVVVLSGFNYSFTGALQSNLITEDSNLYQKLLPEIMSFWLGGNPSLTTRIQALITSYILPLFNIMQRISSYINNALQPFYSTLNSVKQSASNIISYVGTQVHALYNTLYAIIKQGLNDLHSWVNGLIADVHNTINIMETTFNVLLQALKQQIIQIILLNINDLVKGITFIIEQLLGVLMAQLPGIILNIVVDFLQAAEIGEILDKAADTLINYYLEDYPTGE